MMAKSKKAPTEVAKLTKDIEDERRIIEGDAYARLKKLLVKRVRTEPVSLSA